MEVRFQREYRTPYSEGYLILEHDQEVGRIDLHYAPMTVYGTLIFGRELDEDSMLDLRDQIDEELVSTADVTRDDFIVTFYQGRAVATISDESYDEDEDEEEDEEEDEDEDE